MVNPLTDLIGAISIKPILEQANLKEADLGSQSQGSQS